MKYNQKLPTEVEAQLDAYIERIKAIKWFQPKADLKRADIDTQVNIALKAFEVEASIEYKQLKTPEDWGAAWDVAWGAADVLSLNLDGYKKKYPNGNFINLIPLYEAGLYPAGVVNGKFIVYVPATKMEFPEDLIN